MQEPITINAGCELARLNVLPDVRTQAHQVLLRWLQYSLSRSPGNTLIYVTMLLAIGSALLLPQSAEARKSDLGNITSLYPASNLVKMCSNCHADWSGKETRNNAGVAYYLYQRGTAANSTNAFFLNDADGDGSTTGTEYSNSQSASRPALTSKWFPNYSDKDGDGCIQLYSRSDENGMPLTTSGISANGYLGASKGFIRYVPQGWDVDDNDSTQGCSTAWPTSSATSAAFLNPGSTSDVTSPAAIGDFRASALAGGAIPLAWTAVGDDGTAGVAHSYDLRYTTSSLASAKLACGSGSSPCNVRNPADWNLMYDMADSDVDGSAGKYLSKSGGTMSTRSGTWNTGEVAPLMRALYEPLPGAPGMLQACNALGQSSSCAANPGASYVLTAKGSSTITNTIVNGTTYWLAIRVSDGVLTPTHAENPTGFTENISPVSNIIAVTAGPAGTGAAISSISPKLLTAAVGATPVTVTGFGLNTANTAQMVLTNTAGTVVATATGMTYTTGSVIGNFMCGTVLDGTYNLELRTPAGVTKAAWVNAVVVSNYICTPLPVITSVIPNSKGQGATNQNITINGENFGGLSSVSFGSGVTVNSITNPSASQIGLNISVSPIATPGIRDVCVTAAGQTACLIGGFTVTEGPLLICNPSAGIFGVSYSYSCTITGGIPPYYCSATGLPPGFMVDPNNCSVSGTSNMIGTFLGSITVTDANAGSDTEMISIVISATVPSPPTIGPVFPGNGSVIVHFTPPVNNGGAAIISYTATASPGGMTGTCSASPCIVTGLINGTAYTFTVAARNSGGYSAPSAVSNSVVPATVPGIPTILSVFPGNGFCTVNFAAPLSDGGAPILSYTATSSPGNITATGITSPIVVTGLSYGIAYTFTVRAINRVGASPPSVVSPVCYLPYPQLIIHSPMAVVTSDTTATLGATTSSDGGAPIIERGICWSLTPGPAKSGGASCMAAPGTTGTFTVNATGLSRGTLYHFRGYATNLAGTSYTQNATFTTWTVPGAPTNVSAVGGSAQATVSFTPPVNNGGTPITYYTSTCTSSNGGFTAISLGVTSPITVTQLTNERSYTCTVVANNRVGAGPASAASNSVYVYACDAPPHIFSPPMASGVVGEPFSYQILAEFCDGTPVLSYYATGLPPGLSINTSTGLISGIPTTAGTSSVLLYADMVTDEVTFVISAP